MIRILLLVLAMTFVAGCAEKREDLRSPCVGDEGSPCGPRRDVNAWWMA